MRSIVFYEPGTPYAHIFRRFRIPRLGTLVLGTILERAGHRVKVYVDDVRRPSFDDLLEADVVCISAITTTAPFAYAMADRLRARGVTVVLGGPHVTFLTDEALTHADYVFRGEAERAILALVEAVATGRDLDRVAGLSYRQGGQIRHNGPAEAVLDLDELPDPDFGLLQGRFHSNWGFTLVPMQTSRGCPHDCSFCSVTKMFGRSVRWRSVERVLEELVRIPPRSHVFFYDDNFSASRRRLGELVDGMLARRLRLDWSAQVRVDLARDEGLVRRMRMAGCRIVYVGLESVNPETLASYRKGQTVEEIVNGIDVFHRAGIAIHGMFALGADTDTLETVRATADFAVRQRLETVQFLALTPLPGTPVYEDLLHAGRIFVRDWRFYGGYHVTFLPAQMSPWELQTGIAAANERFYSTGQILRELHRPLVAVARTYARRIEKAVARMNAHFTESLSCLPPSRITPAPELPASPGLRDASGRAIATR
jgi:radical SAM superfamily enzyme YgiQ (UPF0313 family)